MKNLWLNDITPRIENFLRSSLIKGENGAFKYSLGGDIYPQHGFYLVGASSFALKIIYTTGLESSFDVPGICDYILSCQKDDLIYDSYVFRRGRIRAFLSSIKNLDLANIDNRLYCSAETRQCLSSLDLYEKAPTTINFPFCKDGNSLARKMNKLNWSTPWSAGSHYSHEMFFLCLAHKLGKIDESLFRCITDEGDQYLSKLQQSDGTWGVGNISARQKINGAMKIITGMLRSGQLNLHEPKKLVDLCLDCVNMENACDNFNVVLVLKYCSEFLGHSYRFDEVCSYFESKLDVYSQHYYEKEGGFSFLPGNSNDNYYGVKIAEKHKLPDLHGTTLFLWGIALMQDMLGLNTKFKTYLT